jgi:hypothetical protein
VAKAEVKAGVCGFISRIEARNDGAVCRLRIESDCAHVRKLADRLTEVDPFREITYRGEGPRTLRVASETCRHPACPVPAGILKAIEVEAGLALPADVSITVERD